MNFASTVKKPVIIKLTLLIGLSSFMPQTQCISSEETAGITVLTIAGLAIGAILYNQLNPSIDTIKNNSFETLQKAVAYDCTMEILNRRFNISYMSPIEQRKNADTVDEYLLNDLVAHINSTTSAEQYLSNIHYLIKDLNYYQEKIESKLTSSKPITDNDRAILSELLHKIKNSKLQLGFLKLYISTHSSYFSLQNICSKFSQLFNSELNLLLKYSNNLHSTNPYLTDELKSTIRAKNLNTLYPYTEFVNDINLKLNQLTNSINKLSYSYHSISSYASDLKHKLTFIKNCIAGSVEYLQEKQMQEHARKEKEKLALKEREVTAKEVEALAKAKEAEIRQQELQNREREIEIKQKELELKEKELINKEIEAMKVNG